MKVKHVLYPTFDGISGCSAAWRTLILLCSMKWCAVLAVISSLCGLGKSFFGDHTTFQCTADECRIWGHPGSSCGGAAVLEQGCRSSVPLGVKQALSADTKARPAPVLPKTQQQPQCALKRHWIMCIQAKKMPFRATCTPQRDGTTSPCASPGTGTGWGCTACGVVGTGKHRSHSWGS